jgi:hypothetical protein
VNVTSVEGGGELRKSVKVPMVVHDSHGKVVRYERADPSDPKSERVYRTLDERVLGEVSGKERYTLYTGQDALLQKLKRIILENRKQSDTLYHSQSASVAGWFIFPAAVLGAFMFGYVRRFVALLMFFPLRIVKRFRG